MTLSLDKLTVPNFIKELNASKKENEGDANEETAKI